MGQEQTASWSDWSSMPASGNMSVRPVKIVQPLFHGLTYIHPPAPISAGAVQLPKKEPQPEGSKKQTWPLRSRNLLSFQRPAPQHAHILVPALLRPRIASGRA